MKARHSWHGSRVAHSRKEPRAGLQGLPLGQPPSSNLRSHRHSRVMPPRHGITVHGQSRNDTHGDAALPPPRATPLGREGDHAADSPPCPPPAPVARRPHSGAHTHAQHVHREKRSVRPPRRALPPLPAGGTGGAGRRQAPAPYGAVATASAKPTRSLPKS